jgi:hypothetical protein
MKTPRHLSAKTGCQREPRDESDFVLLGVFENIFRTAIAHAVMILDAHNRHNLLRLLNLADALDWTSAGLIAKWRQALTPTKFSTIIVMASSMESRARLARYYLLARLKPQTDKFYA